MKIRIATADDAGGIAHVHVESWRTAYAKLLPADFLAGLSRETRKDHWLKFLSSNVADAFTFVAELDGKIVGFINGGPERTSDPRFAAEIYAIYLLENYRRQGIGTALFCLGVEFLLSHQMDSMNVWVLRDNPYQTFYERQGGKVLGEKVITIGGTELIETAYGWETLEPFRQRTSIRRVRND